MTKRTPLLISLIVIPLVCFFYVVLNWDSQYFKNLFLLPLFFIFFVPVLNHRILTRGKSVFVFCFFSFCFLRYVVLPFLMTLSGYDGGRASIPPKQESTELAIIMMGYELLVCSIILFFVGKREPVRISSTFSSNNNMIYFLFVAFSLFLLILVPSVLKNINFIYAKDEFERAFNSEGILYAIALYSALTAKSLLYCLMTIYCANRHNKSNRIIYLIVNLIACLLNIVIYYGASRITIIATAVSSLIFMYALYKNKKIIIAASTVIVAVLVVVLISLTAARGIIYGSGAGTLADTISVYTGGPYNVAIALEVPSKYPEVSTVGTFIYDFTRPIIGLGYLVDSPDMHYSVYYFNYRMTDGRYFSQILPMIGQGFFYFGYLLAPLFSGLWIMIGMKLEKRANRTTHPELYYFLIFNALRISTFMGQSSINQVNSLSMNLLLFLILYFINTRSEICKNGLSRG